MTKIFMALLLCLPTLAAAQDMNLALQSSTLQYFIDNANTTTGLVRDQAENFIPTPATNTLASIAATGFGLTVITNAAARGLIDADGAATYFDTLMRFCRDHLPREHGWFLHWVDWQTGAPVGPPYNDDYSSIDSSFLIAGALYAAQIFPDSEGAAIARQLYRAMDFKWLMTDGGKYPDRRTLSIGYSAMQGFSPYQWSIYAEQMVLVILGLGSPTYPLPSNTWTQWERHTYSVDGFSFVALDMPMFVHQYSQLFLDFRAFDDGYPNYYLTSVQATDFNRFEAAQTAINAGFWGFSAGQAPGSNGDESYGVFSAEKRPSTICIGCAIGSAMFRPQMVLADAATWFNGPYVKQIWGTYGFSDSIDLQRGWFSQKALGITVGAAYLSLANMNPETAIWTDFMQIPEIQVGLQKAQNSRRMRQSKME